MVINYQQNVRPISDIFSAIALSHFTNTIFLPDIIHTVGPIGEHSQDLQSCYENSLQIASENGLKSIVSLISLVQYVAGVFYNLIFLEGLSVHIHRDLRIPKRTSRPRRNLDDESIPAKKQQP